jgi:ABC-type uncharacterized transport system substrate-binding protein
MRGTVALPGSKSTSRAKEMHRKLEDPASGHRQCYTLVRVGTYTRRILKGTKPAEFLIDQNIQFELVINLKIAGALGLVAPPSLLARHQMID